MFGFAGARRDIAEIRPADIGAHGRRFCRPWVPACWIKVGFELIGPLLQRSWVRGGALGAHLPATSWLVAPAGRGGRLCWVQAAAPWHLAAPACFEICDRHAILAVSDLT